MHKLAWNKLQGFLFCKFLIVETEVTFASHLATTVDSGEMHMKASPYCQAAPEEWVMRRRWNTQGFITRGLCFPTEILMPSSSFTAHSPPYKLCVWRTETFRVPGCLKLHILKLFIIGHFSQGTAAKAFFQKGEISLAVTMGKLLVTELRQGWRKVKAVRVNPRWDASLHLHAVS